VSGDASDPRRDPNLLALLHQIVEQVTASISSGMSGHSKERRNAATLAGMSQVRDLAIEALPLTVDPTLHEMLTELVRRMEMARDGKDPGGHLIAGLQMGIGLYLRENEPPPAKT
jgi:hypothetical protein